jgi:hypothetical protein
MALNRAEVHLRKLIVCFSGSLRFIIVTCAGPRKYFFSFVDDILCEEVRVRWDGLKPWRR